jgi:hypothetical protein
MDAGAVNQQLSGDKSMQVEQKVAVSRDALVKRLNRRLLRQRLMLRITRGIRNQVEYGEAWVHNLDGNTIHCHHVDIEHYARISGLLAGYEAMSRPV